MFHATLAAADFIDDAAWTAKPSGDGYYWYRPGSADAELVPADLAGDLKVVQVFDGGKSLSVADVSVDVADVSGEFYGPLTPPGQNTA